MLNDIIRIFHHLPVQMEFSGLVGIVYAITRLCRGTAETDTRELETAGTHVFNVCVNDCTISFLVAYEFTHSFINIPMMSFICTIHS